MTFPAWAGPTGGQVVGGQAIIQSLNQETLIKQSTSKAIINWNAFSILQNQSVVFQQPTSQSIALNRVLGGSPSMILGSLQANGQVWLVNPNGVLFGKTATVNAAGILATTADIANSDFLNGNYNFGTPSPNPNAGIANYGTIDTPGGSTVLAAPTVDNEGTIEARLGTVAVGAGSTFTVDFDGDNLLNFQVASPAATAQIKNGGTLAADGGTVQVTARAAGAIVDNVINTTGIVQANSVSIQNGTVTLDAGNGGVTVGGTVSTQGTTAGTTGGTVHVLGGAVNVAAGASIDASGQNGGGTVLIGGNFHGTGPQPNAQTTSIAAGATIAADATVSGNGGKVAVWSNESTIFNGSISARGGPQGGNGGYVETSSAADLSIGTGMVNTRALNGLIGTWRVDPTNIVVADNSGTITPAAIDSSTSNVTLAATGDITFTNAVGMANNGVGLAAEAGNSIFVNAPITTNGGSITLSANDPNESPTGNGLLQLNAALNTAGSGQAGGNVLLTLNGATGAGSSIFLGAGITTESGTIMLQSPTVLTSDVMLDATNGGAAASGANVTFASTLDDIAAYTDNLTIAAGTAGNVTFDGRVGDNNPITSDCGSDQCGTAVGVPLNALTIESGNNVNVDILLDPTVNGQTYLDNNGLTVGSFVVEGNGNAGCLTGGSACAPGAVNLNAPGAYISTFNGASGNAGPITIDVSGNVEVGNQLYAGGYVNSSGTGGSGGAVIVIAGGNVQIGDQIVPFCDGEACSTPGALADIYSYGIFAAGYYTNEDGGSSGSHQTAGSGGNVFVQAASINLPAGVNTAGGSAIIDAANGAAGGNAGTVTLTATSGNVSAGAPQNGNLVGIAAVGGSSASGNPGDGAAVSVSGTQLFLSNVYAQGGDTELASIPSGYGQGGAIALTASESIGPALTLYGESDTPNTSSPTQATLDADGGEVGGTSNGSSIKLAGGIIAGQGGNITVAGGQSDGGPLPLNGSAYVQLADNAANSNHQGGPTVAIFAGGGAATTSPSILIDGPIEGTTTGAEALRLDNLINGATPTAIGSIEVNGMIGSQTPLGYVSFFGAPINLDANIATVAGNFHNADGSANALGGQVEFDGAVSLQNDATISTTGGNPFGGNGGNIYFGLAVPTSVDGAHALTLDTGGSGSAGLVTFCSATSCSTTNPDGPSNVGATIPLTQLLVQSGGSIRLQQVTTSGSQYYVTENSGDAIYIHYNLTAGKGVTPSCSTAYPSNSCSPGSDIQFLAGTIDIATPSLTLATNGTLAGGEIYLGGALSGDYGTLTLNTGTGLIVYGGAPLQNPVNGAGVQNCPVAGCTEGPTITVSGPNVLIANDNGPEQTPAHILLTGDTTLNVVSEPLFVTVDSALGSSPAALTIVPNYGGTSISSSGTVGDAAPLSSVTVTASSGTTPPVTYYAVSLGSIGSPVVAGSIGAVSITGSSINLGGYVTTAGGAVQVNGPATLASNLAIDTTAFNAATGADIAFASTIDATTAGAQGLSLNAGTGGITLGGNVGTTTALGAVSLSANGSNDGGDAINAEGNITTQGGAVSLNGPVVLGGDVTVDTTNAGVAAGGAVAFNGTVDGSNSDAQSLTVNAGIGAVTLTGNLGAGQALGDVTLSSSSRISLGGNITTEGSIGESTIGNVAIDGPAVLTNPVTIDTTNGGNTSGANISFSGTVDGTSPGNQWLILKANDTPQADLDNPGNCCGNVAGEATPSTNGGVITLGGNLGDGVALGEVELTGSQINVGGDITTSGGQISAFAGDPNNAATLGMVLTTNGAVTFSTGSGPVNLFYTNNIDGTVAGQQGLTIDSSATAVLPPAVGGNVPLGPLTVVGPVEVHGNVTTAGGPIDFGGGGTVFLNATLDTTGSNAVSTGADITIGGPLAAGNASLGLGLNGGSQGVVTLDGDVGDGTPFASVYVTGATLNLGGNITTNGGGLAVNIDAATVLQNSVTVDTSEGDGNILFGRTDAANAGVQGLTLNAGTGDIDLGNSGPVGGTTPLGAVAMTSQNVQLFSSITTSNGAITINGGNTPIFNNVTLDTTAGGAVSGANIVVNGTLNNQTCCAGLGSITFNAGTAAATFNGAIGGSAALGNLTVTGGSIAFNSAVTAAGALTLTGGSGNSITATGGVNLGSFILLGGNWTQIDSTLPPFAATDFELQGGTFVRALGGDGSGGNPYQITDVYGLQGVGTLLADNFVIKNTNGIDASGTSAWNGGAGFIPIGNDNTGPFTGTLNGQNYTVSGLTIDSGAAAVGLFGTNAGTVSNLILANANVTSTGSGASAGALVGINTGTISNASAAGMVAGTSSDGGDANLGGLVGYNNGGTINGGSFANVTVTDNANYAEDSLGGLVGLNDNGGIISQTYAIGAVTASGDIVDNGVGGLVGTLTSGSIDQSFATGPVTNNNGDNEANLGGLVGTQNAGAITNSYATGAVTSVATGSATYIGGLVGWQIGGSIAGSYSIGLVQCDGCSQGGLIGVGGGTVDGLSFWDTQTSQQSSSAGGQGLTTANAQSQGYLEGIGWTFYPNSTIWSINSGSSYPQLLWHSSSPPPPSYEIVSGTAPDDATVDLLVNGGGLETTAAGGSGSYSFSLAQGTTGDILIYLPSGDANLVTAINGSGASGLGLASNVVGLIANGGGIATSMLAGAEGAGSAGGGGILFSNSGHVVTLQSGIALNAAGGGNNVTVDYAVTTSGGAGVILNGAAIALGANITTAGGMVTLAAPTTLTADLTINTTAGGASPAPVEFGSTVDGAQALTVAGNGVFNGAVGATTNLTSLYVSGTSVLDGGAVTTTGAQTYNGAATLGVDDTLTGSTVSFGSTVDGAQVLTVTGNGVFNGAVGATTNLTSLYVSGTSVLDGGAVTTTGAQTYNGAATLGVDDTLTASTVSFGSTVDGAQALTVAGNGVFNGAVGATTNLTSLSVSGTSVLDGGAVTTTGAQTYDGAVTLGVDDTLTASAVTFGSTVDGAQALTVAGNTLSVYGDIGANVPLSGLAVQANSINLNGANIVTSDGAVDLTGPVVVGHSLMIDTTDHGTSPGASITVDAFGAIGTIEDAAPGADTLTMTAGLGYIYLYSSIGDATPLRGLTLSSANQIGIAGNVGATSGGIVLNGGQILLGLYAPLEFTTAGGQVSINGPAQLYANLAIDTTNDGTSSGAGVTFGGTLDDTAWQTHSLTIAAGDGDVNFNRRVGIDNAGIGVDPGAVTIISADNVNMTMPFGSSGNGFSAKSFTIGGNAVTSATCASQGTGCTQGATGNLAVDNYLVTVASGNGGNVVVDVGGSVTVGANIVTIGNGANGDGSGGNGGLVSIIAGGNVSVFNCCQLDTMATSTAFIPGTQDRILSHDATSISTYGGTGSTSAGNGGAVSVTSTNGYIELGLGVSAAGGFGAGSLNGGNGGTINLTAPGETVAVGQYDNSGNLQTGNVAGLFSVGGASASGNGGNGGNIAVSAQNVLLPAAASFGGSTQSVSASGGAGGNIILVGTESAGAAVTLYGESENPTSVAPTFSTLNAAGGASGAVELFPSSPDAGLFLVGGTLSGKAGNVTVGSTSSGAPLNGSSYIQLVDDSSASTYYGGPTVAIIASGADNEGGAIILGGPVQGTVGTENLRLFADNGSARVTGNIGDATPLYELVLGCCGADGNGNANPTEDPVGGTGGVITFEGSVNAATVIDQRLFANPTLTTTSAIYDGPVTATNFVAASDSTNDGVATELADGATLSGSFDGSQGPFYLAGTLKFLAGFDPGDNADCGGVCFKINGPITLIGDATVDESAVNDPILINGAGAFVSQSNGGESLTVLAGSGAITVANGGAFGAAGDLLKNLTLQGGTIDLNNGGITTTGAQTYNGAVVLTANTLLTSTDAGTIDFDKTVDAQAAGGESLAVNTAGTTIFGGAVGTTALSSLAVTGPADLDGGAVTTAGTQSYGGAVLLGTATILATTNGNVTFGGAVTGSGEALTVNSGSGTIIFDSTVGASGQGIGAVNLIATGTTTLDNNVDAASLSVSGPMALGGSLSVVTDKGDTGASSDGAIAFGGNIGGSGDNLTLNAGSATVTLAGITANRLNILGAGSLALNAGTYDLTGQTAGIALPLPIALSGSITLDDSVSLGSALAPVLLAADTSVTGGSASDTIQLVGTLNGAHALTVTGPQTTIVENVVGGSAPPTSLSVSGQLNLQANVTTSGPQSYSGAVTIGANDTLTTTNSAVTFGGAVTGSGEALTVNSGSGAVAFDSTAGATGAPLGILALNSTGTATLDGTVYAASLAVTGPADLDGGAVTTAGVQSYGGAVLLGAPTILATTSGNVTFGGAVTGSGEALTVNSGSGTIIFDSTVGASGQGIGAVNLIATGTTTLDNNVDAASLSVSGPMALGGSLSVVTDKSDTGASSDGAIAFGGNIGGSGDNLTLDAGSATVTLAGITANRLNILDAGSLALNAGTYDLTGQTAGIALPLPIALSGSITLDDSVSLGSTLAPVLLAADTSVTGGSASDTIQLVGTLNGAHALTVTGPQTTIVENVVGGSAPPTSLSVSGPLNLQANVTTSGPQSYSGAVTIGANDTLTTTNSGVDFGGTVDDAAADTHSLTVSAGTGGVTFGGAVGATTELASLGTTGTTGANILDGNVTTGGAQSYGGPVTLAANILTGGGAITVTGPLTLTGTGAVLNLNTTGQGQVPAGANITLGGTVDAQTGQGLNLNGGTGGTVTIDGIVGGNSPNGFGPVAISGANIDLNAQAVAPAADINTAGQPVTIDGNLVFTANQAINSNGGNIIVDVTPGESNNIDPTLFLDAGTMGAVNGTITLGQGYFLTLEAGSSSLSGTVNGASGAAAAQYVTVIGNCASCTMNGAADLGSQPPSSPPTSSSSTGTGNTGAAQTLAQSNTNTVSPSQTNQSFANQTPSGMTPATNQEAAVASQSTYEEPPAYLPSDTDAPPTVTAIDNGASLFIAISPTTSTDLTASSGSSGSDAIVVAYANPAAVKPAANAEASHPQVVHPLAAYLNQMLTPTVPRGGVPGISFGYSLSGNSALW